jgi:hypothetical protein
MSKLQAISQQLNLTPQQKVKVLPILWEEAPKVEAIKNNKSLSQNFRKCNRSELSINRLILR